MPSSKMSSRPGAVDREREPERARHERRAATARCRPAVGMPGSIAGSPRPGDGAQRRRRACTRRRRPCSCGLEVGGHGDQLAQRVLDERPGTAPASTCPTARRAARAARSGAARRCVAGVSAGLSQNASARFSDRRRVDRLLRLRGIERAACRGSRRRRSSGRGTSRCRASASRPSRRRSAGRRAAGPQSCRSTPTRRS